MNPPKVIVNAEPPKEWFEIVGRGLERHNTAATSIVEYYRSVSWSGKRGTTCGVASMAASGTMDARRIDVGRSSSARARVRDRVDGSGRSVRAIEGCVASFLQTGASRLGRYTRKLGYRVYGRSTIIRSKATIDST